MPASHLSHSAAILMFTGRFLGVVFIPLLFWSTYWALAGKPEEVLPRYRKLMGGFMGVLGLIGAVVLLTVGIDVVSWLREGRALPWIREGLIFGVGAYFLLLAFCALKKLRTAASA